MTHITANDSLETPAKSRWGAPRCGYRTNAFMLWTASHFLWLGYFFVFVAALYFFLFHARARRASLAYLDRLHAPQTRNPFTRYWQTYRHMVAYGILLLDRALMLARPGHGFEIDCDGMLHLANLAKNRPSGVVLLSAHFGMAEIAAPYLQRIGFQKPAHIVMYQNPRDGTERFHARHRQMLNHVDVISTIDPLAAGLKIIAALRQGDIVAMRADRTLDGKSINATLLNDPLSLPAGPFVAAALSDAPILYIDTVRLSYRRYRCIISPSQYIPEASADRDTRVAGSAQDFATHLEALLKRFPYQWANFFDLWKAQPPTSPISPAP